MTNMENEAYHADVTRIGKSGLDLIARSPAHYWAKYLDPNRQPEAKSPALSMGTAVHHAILEPHIFERRYRIMPEINRQSTAGKVQYQEIMLQANEHRWVMITKEEYDKACRMRDAAHKHPTLSVLLGGGKVEQTVFWTEPETGAKCKSRMDFISDTGFIVDVKTTEDASPTGFAKSVWNYRYYVQSPFYLDALLNDGRPADGFVFAAIEKEPPHAIGLYYATDAINTRGRATYLRDLRTYLKCLETNEWPSYSEQLEPLQLPAWAK